MFNIIISIQYFSIVVLFLECWLVIRNWKNGLHSYLFLGCVSTLVNSIGYLFELQAKSEASFVTALQLSYFGRVWITFAFFMFSARLSKVKIPMIHKARWMMETPLFICIFSVKRFHIHTALSSSGAAL